MSLETFSAFYYGFTINELNNKINFNEGSGELVATIDSGSYSFSELMLAAKTAMDAVASVNTYLLSINRTTRQASITGDTGVFDLLTNSGSQSGVSAFPLLGYSTAGDLTGLLTYESQGPGGSEYIPQFILQSYVEPGDHKERIDSSINESASGNVEVVGFGTREFISMDIKFITDLPMDGRVIRNNPTGHQDAKDFMTGLIERGNLEFMPSISDRATFLKVKLESTPESEQGTGFKLKEMTGESLPFIYGTGILKFRVVS